MESAPDIFLKKPMGKTTNQKTKLNNILDTIPPNKWEKRNQMLAQTLKKEGQAMVITRQIIEGNNRNWYPPQKTHNSRINTIANPASFD